MTSVAFSGMEGSSCTVDDREKVWSVVEEHEGRGPAVSRARDKSHAEQTAMCAPQKVEVYCQGMIPGLWPFMWLLVVMKAMQSQNVMQPAAWVTSAIFFLNIPINWLMIQCWGFLGAAYAQSAVRILWLLFMLGAALFFCTASACDLRCLIWKVKGC